MYTKKEVKTLRLRNIERLASYGFENPTSLYNRIVRFARRYFRWGEDHCNGHLTGWRLDEHEHEGELLAKLGDHLNCELLEHGLWLTYPGLYPEVTSEGDCHPIELVWY